MKLNYFGSGPFLEFFENGTVLSHGEHTIDCAQLQGDSQVTVDVCMDGDGNLTFGPGGSATVYVANVIIPARQWQEQVVQDESGNPVLDDDDQEEIEKVALELDMGQVTGNLWTMPVPNTEET